jgi:hypothetical protein
MLKEAFKSKIQDLRTLWDKDPLELAVWPLLILGILSGLALQWWATKEPAGSIVLETNNGLPLIGIAGTLVGLLTIVGGVMAWVAHNNWGDRKLNRWLRWMLVITIAVLYANVPVIWASNLPRHGAVVMSTNAEVLEKNEDTIKTTSWRGLPYETFTSDGPKLNRAQISDQVEILMVPSVGRTLKVISVNPKPRMGSPIQNQVWRLRN